MTGPGSQHPGTLTLLLRRSAEGDADAREQAWSMTYGELRALAIARLSREPGRITWQPTELVNEAYLKLGGLAIAFHDRAHFMAMAATAMRQVLIDHARSRRSDKRGGGATRVTLDSRWIEAGREPEIDLLDLDRALQELATHDARKARAIELSYFGGMTDAEAAAALEVSEATLKRDLRMARAWLATALEERS
jgi:RNA polymerase sigma factor (TIGR02999 family)